MGGYVIVGQALAAFLEIELEASIDKAKEVIVKGQKWYVCDIVGERVFGQALVFHFGSTIVLLERMTSLEEPEVSARISPTLPSPLVCSLVHIQKNICIQHKKVISCC